MMKRPLPNGKLNAGRPLKKSPPPRPHGHLCRRVGAVRAPHPREDLGTRWGDPGVAVAFQLEAVVADRRRDVLELLLPVLSQHDQIAPDHRFPAGADSTDRRPLLDYMGRPAGTSQQAGARLRGIAGRADRTRTPSRICAGTESGGIFVRLYQTAGACEPAPVDYRGSKAIRGPATEELATASQRDHCVLAAGRTGVLMLCI